MSDTSPRWQTIQRLFREALAVPIDERAAFLEARCGGDVALRQEVQKLVDAAGATDGEFRRIVRNTAVGAAAAEAERFRDQRIGNYRLIDILGIGGMGNVYLAERADRQFEHRVAVKLLHPGQRDRAILERFRSERQMLANLQHPNIARLLDGGETSTGIPYFVMEYVDGLPIDRYCDEKRLSVQERLRLFQKICSAVDYAHRNLVVHRDIKPTNILVTGDGEPMLLDFGIAKFLDDGAAALTREGGGVMTPEYASPEQLLSEPISTATDIYSMGVLLYRMLCGRMPRYTARGMRTDLARAMLETEPSRPSAALTQAAAGERAEQTAEDIGRARGTSAVRLRKRLQGDLDNIVLMALRREPERRYASARALSLDIDNYLAHRPVSARRDSLAYRSAKFLRRYRIAVVLGVVVAAALAGTWLQVVEQRNRATVAAVQAERIIGFLGELFASASPLKAQGEEITAADLLAAGVREVAELDDQPAVQARLLEIMGTSYNWIGDLDEARPLLERALAIRERQLPHDPAAIAHTLKEIGENQRVSDELVAAEQTLQRSLELLQQAFGDRHSRVAYVLNRLGDVLRMQHRQQEALTYLERAAAMKEALGETEDADAIDTYGNLAIVLDELGRLEEAEAMNVRAVQASRTALGSKHPNTVVRIGNLGLIQMRRGNYAEALANIGEAYDSIHEIWSSDPFRLFWAANSQGNVLRFAGRFEEAWAAYEEMLELTRTHYGEDDWRYPTTLRVQGLWLMDKARYDEAFDRLTQAVRAAEKIPEDLGRDVPRARIRIAELYSIRGNFAAAEETARLALAQPDRLPPATRLHLLRELAVSVSGQGRYDEASVLFEEALRGREAFSGAESDGMLEFLVDASRHHRRAGDPAYAVELARRADAIGRTITPAGNWQAAFATAEHALALQAAGRREEAAPLMQRALTDLTATFGAGDPRIAELRASLAGSGDLSQP